VAARGIHGGKLRLGVSPFPICAGKRPSLSANAMQITLATDFVWQGHRGFVHGFGDGKRDSMFTGTRRLMLRQGDLPVNPFMTARANSLVFE